VRPFNLLEQTVLHGSCQEQAKRRHPSQAAAARETSMNDEERFAAGMAVRRRTFGGSVVGGGVGPLAALRIRDAWGSTGIALFISGVAVFSAICVTSLRACSGEDIGVNQLHAGADDGLA
jgi:hypothetical protein